MTTTVYSTSTADKSILLRRVLRVNAISSLGSALLLILASAPVAEWMGMESPGGATLLLILGFGFAIFGGVVWYTANTQPLNTRLAWVITALDLAWVALSAVLLLTNALSLSTAGNWAVLIVADLVLALGVLEFIGVRRVS
jgi:hypothetical protein